MIFRIATINDMDDIRDIYASVIGNKYCVWNSEYPGEEELNNDIKTNNLYVLEINGEIVGSISIVDRNELDEYPVWSSNNAKEIARVAIKAADAAAKAANITLIEVRIGYAVGGKGYVTLTGDIGSVRAAVKSAIADSDLLVNTVIIPRPSEKVIDSLL